MGWFPDEAAAWAAAVDGDAEGLAVVFDRYLDRVYRHALRLSGSRHDAEDLTAGAFLELWRRRRQVRMVDGSVLPWLLVTVTNLARNRARGLRRYRRLLASLPRTESIHPGADDILDQQIAAGSAKRLQQALGQLSASQAALVSLVSFEGYTPAQAAGVLGITPAAARTRLHRARRRIELALAGEPTPPDGLLPSLEDHPT
ncbi:MAG: sigma-70 family RNA polymerase sigma factor [Actinomycetota bacterium]|nr:sigma-70 family RNA polymerase sigma factor [Actinomycetota bacterium]